MVDGPIFQLCESYLQKIIKRLILKYQTIKKKSSSLDMIFLIRFDRNKKWKYLFIFIAEDIYRNSLPLSFKFVNIFKSYRTLYSFYISFCLIRSLLGDTIRILPM